MILKLKRSPGIYLVGFMACGKTTVGRCLADELGWHFVDIDDDIVALAGKTAINNIFETQGEEAFRKLETEAITARVHIIECGNPTVVALGGGAIARQDVYELISVNGVSIWLDCPLEVMQKRAARETHRPLAKNPGEFAELYKNRLPCYQRADFRVEVTSDDPQSVVRQILNLPMF